MRRGRASRPGLADAQLVGNRPGGRRPVV